MKFSFGNFEKAPYSPIIIVILSILLYAVSSLVSADNAVKLKVLVVTTGNETQDPGFAYIKPVLDEMGVPYVVLNAATESLTAAKLSPGSCLPSTVGCIGNYNGIILTNSDLSGNFLPSEWAILHKYETNFKVRESVISGWLATYSESGQLPYLDYGLSYTSSITSPVIATWQIPSTLSKEIFEYVNTANPLTITDFAFAGIPRNNGTVIKDGTVPNVTPLLKAPSTTAAPNGQALLSIIRYIVPGQTAPAREVMFSSISNASFLLHSQVLAYELINYATQGVHLGGRFVYMSAHLDDLFIPNELWDTVNNKTQPSLTYRLNSNDIINAVTKQATFRTSHPTAGSGFKLDFPFNGAGAVVDPSAATLSANLTEGLVSAVVTNKTQFRFISHTFTHADMDKPPVPANAPCDYPTLTTSSAIIQEINKNRTVWGLLGLPEQSANNRVLVSGNHSGLKDRKCTDIPELHPEMANVQDDDVPYVAGANPLFFQAAMNRNVAYVASDSSQVGQAVEHYISGVNDGSASDRLMLPRWPTSIFFNVINPTQLVDEYNYIYYTLLAGTPGGISAPRNYSQILAAEAETALRHMLTYKKWPHFFHQTNLAAFNAAGNTLQFDWLNAVYTAYEKLYKLPVKNLPYYQIGDMTRDKLAAKSASINATWDRTTNKVSLVANKSLVGVMLTGVRLGENYGGQSIRQMSVTTTSQNVYVDRALTQ